MLVVIAIVVYLLVRFVFNQKQTNINSQPTSFEITKGQSVKEIVNNLANKNIISNKFRFYYLYYRGKKNLQAGIYLIKPNDKLDNIYTKITNGQISEEKITIPEGWRKEQIAQLLSQKKLANYESFMALAQDSEGKLFPDTYRIQIESDTQSIYNKFIENYKLKTKDLNLSQEQLIIASIIEREAKFDEDRAGIASVFYNRLKSDLKLEADPTVIYAIDNNKLENINVKDIESFEFWQKIKSEDIIKNKSNYNTYFKNGLPPGPISNPGIKSINAAQNPEQTQYYYFISDNTGKAHFAKTKAEHEKNILEYLKK